MDKTLGVQVLTQLADLENIPTDLLPTTTLEDRESLGQRNTLTLLGTASYMTRMDLTGEKEEEEATVARNKSRCLLALDVLSDRWTLPLSPLISHSSLLSTVWSWPTSETRGAPTHAHISHTCLASFVFLNFASDQRTLSTLLRGCLLTSPALLASIYYLSAVLTWCSCLLSCPFSRTRSISAVFLRTLEKRTWRAASVK